MTSWTQKWYGMQLQNLSFSSSFTLCGICNHMDLAQLHHQEQEQKPLDATCVAGPNNFNIYFKNFLEVPCDEYMVYKDECQAEQPNWALISKAYIKAGEANDLVAVKNIPPMMTTGQATDFLKDISKLWYQWTLAI